MGVCGEFAAVWLCGELVGGLLAGCLFCGFGWCFGVVLVCRCVVGGFSVMYFGVCLVCCV